MSNSSQLAFLKDLIDYAGIYPPASLSLDQAIRNYADFLIDKDAWMLGRFILPASRLVELDPYISLFSLQKPLRCSALGRWSDSKELCIEGLKADLLVVKDFRERYGGMVNVDVLELPLPPILIDRELITILAKEASEEGLDLFCEVTAPINQEWQRQMQQALEEIATHNAFGGPIVGLKLRTGGVTADAFPSAEQVATILHACQEGQIALKFTAGLHHPIRMYRDEVKTRMHGFLNIFAAGMLAHVYNLDVLAIGKILADEERDHFLFTEEGLAWNHKIIPVSEITKLRLEYFRSFGSCSFEEPREDLRLLKLL